MAIRIRPASSADAEAMLAIYAPVVEKTVISWEYEPPTLSEFEARIDRVLEAGFPWLALEEDRTILGYAYASSYRERYAYRFCCESTIYMHADARGRGLGKRLYGVLCEVLRRQGFVSVIGGLALPNAGSEALHRSLGFRPSGIQEKIGFKFGEWLDLCLTQKDLAPRVEPSLAMPESFSELWAAGRLADLLDAL